MLSLSGKVNAVTFMLGVFSAEVLRTNIVFPRKRKTFHIQNVCVLFGTSYAEKRDFDRYQTGANMGFCKEWPTSERPSPVEGVLQTDSSLNQKPEMRSQASDA